MKIVVIGGTGLTGSKLVAKLRDHGHDAVAAALPQVNTLTGEGLAEALSGTDVMVDVSNSPSFDDAAVMNFFQTSTRNLLAAEAAEGVRHHVALSVVGTERLSESGYFRAKIAQDDAQPARRHACCPRRHRAGYLRAAGCVAWGEATLQPELQRESLEKDPLGGDTASDRNLSGASSWITVPSNA